MENLNSTPPNLPPAGEPLRVLFVAAEADPWVKVGGLGDFAGALPQALRSLPPEHAGGSRLDIRLALPCHDVIRQTLHPKNPLVEFTILRGAVEVAGAAYLETSGEQQVLLIDGPPFQTGAPVYNSDSKQSTEQYTFFSLAALETTRRLGWKPHILHANDWHTAIAVYWLFLHRSRVPFFSKTRTVFSLHNLPYFGYNAEETLTAYGIPPAADPRLPTWARHLPLPLGLHAADQIVAVSPSYAREILTPAFGCGLQDYLKTRSNSISGILNGLDTNAWNPAADPALEAHFDAHDLTPRSINKEALQRELELSLLPDVPLLALISRLDPQKGVDLVIEGLRQISDLEWQAVLLGTGDTLLASAIRQLEHEFPGRVRSILAFDSRLARRMYAGADILMMPSRYEPCGLAQMIAMRYGCIPVARATGGLKDTIIDDPDPNRSTGLLFNLPEIKDFTAALRRVLSVYSNRSLWHTIQTNAMRQDFSWQLSARAYASLYRKLIAGVNPATEIIE